MIVNRLQIMYKKDWQEITLILVIVVSLTVSSSVMQLSHEQSNKDLENIMLKIHNQERAAVGVPPLTWSNNLAADSQSWTNNLTTLGLVCDDQRCDAPPYGGKKREHCFWSRGSQFTGGTCPGLDRQKLRLRR